MRTGGTTADAFPSSEQLVRFIAACVGERVPIQSDGRPSSSAARRLCADVRRTQRPRDNVRLSERVSGHSVSRGRGDRSDRACSAGRAEQRRVSLRRRGSDLGRPAAEPRSARGSRSWAPSRRSDRARFVSRSTTSRRSDCSDVLDETHRADLRSWVESANDPSSDFPIQNLPLGVFRGSGGVARVGVAIGDQVLSVDAALRLGLLDGDAREAARSCEHETLNRLMALGPNASRALRRGLVNALRDDTDAGARARRCSRRAGRARPPTSRCSCRPRSATTPTSTLRFITRRTSAACSGPTTRCCLTTSTFRSAITGARRRS